MVKIHSGLYFCDKNLLVWLKCLFTISPSLGAGEIGYSKSIVRRALEHMDHIFSTPSQPVYGKAGFSTFDMEGHV